MPAVIMIRPFPSADRPAVRANGTVRPSLRPIVKSERSLGVIHDFVPQGIVISCFSDKRPARELERQLSDGLLVTEWTMRTEHTQTIPTLAQLVAHADTNSL